MSDIFISYKQDDRARVQLLADALEAKGWDVWWVKVRNKRGQVGWSMQDDHFDDMDACG